MNRSTMVGAAVALSCLVPLTACTHSADGAAAAGSTAAASSTSGSTGGSTGTSQPPAADGAMLQQKYVSTISSVLRSVVLVRTSAGLGSGVVFDDKGDIVTNHHVVGNATRFQVSLAGSSKPYPATLVGSYAPDDLAVIRVDGAPSLHPATFGDSSKLQVGDIVLAMGNPLGLAGSVTNGIVSALGRTLSEPPESGSTGGTATLPDMIQTSAAINPGNSGGALVDLAGDVVGIPTLAATDQQLGGGAAPGIGFAISANVVKDIAGQLVAHGKVVNSHRAALGITASTVTDDTGAPQGAGIVSVQAGGAAAKAGLQPGDVLVGLAGQRIESVQQLTAVLAGLTPGHSVPAKVRRSGQTRTFSVTLGTLPG